jgi:hypothetical protein
MVFFSHLPAADEDSKEQSDSESNSNGLIRMLAQQPIGSFSGRARLCFNFVARFFGGLKRGSQPFPRRKPALSQVLRTGLQQFLGVMYDRSQIFHQLLS